VQYSIMRFHLFNRFDFSSPQKQQSVELRLQTV
jgi:hypothetical protein